MFSHFGDREKRESVVTFLVDAVQVQGLAFEDASSHGLSDIQRGLLGMSIAKFEYFIAE